ncbi:hypothetical protein BGP_0211 [Beggiatoa sp. PS]|nr:hypothetical protein BGP_0211 [Beggiatoa sp. PS]
MIRLPLPSWMIRLKFPSFPLKRFLKVRVFSLPLRQAQGPPNPLPAGRGNRSVAFFSYAANKYNYLYYILFYFSKEYENATERLPLPASYSMHTSFI